MSLCENRNSRDPIGTNGSLSTWRRLWFTRLKPVSFHHPSPVHVTYLSFQHTVVAGPTGMGSFLYIYRFHFRAVQFTFCRHGCTLHFHPLISNISFIVLPTCQLERHTQWVTFSIYTVEHSQTTPDVRAPSFAHRNLKNQAILKRMDDFNILPCRSLTLFRI